MKLSTLCGLVVLAATTFGAQAARQVFPAPACNSSMAACKEWQQAVQIANEDAGDLKSAGGQQTPAPRNKQQVMKTCVHYEVTVKHVPASSAQAICRSMYLGI